MMVAAAFLCLASLLPAVDGIALDNDSIRAAFAAWLADPAAAEATYGHISTWETGGVTDMSWLFCGSSSYSSYGCNTAASSLNEDIGAWDTSGVTNMRYMFYYASAFNQDLGWCVDDDVDLYAAFYSTQCESTSCGILPSAAQQCGGGPMSDSGIRLAVAAWLSDSAAAEAAYGHISSWETGGVTDMSMLFCVRQDWMDDWSSYDDCVLSTSSFNEDIGAWNTSGVTAMDHMFYEASSFNGDIGGWAVQKVTDMERMFQGASTFDQDLGWCVDYGVDLDYAFSSSGCVSTSCGIVGGVDCDIPYAGNVMDNRKIRTAVAAWLADKTAAEAKYGDISTWDTSGVTDMSWLFCVRQDWMSSIRYSITYGNCVYYSPYYSPVYFNPDIRAWDTSSVTTMDSMFLYASGFDQDLVWCLDDGVVLRYAFSYTGCSSTSCGVRQGDACAPTPAPTTTAPTVSPAPSPIPTRVPTPQPTINNVMTDSNIRTAVYAWLTDAAAAQATYGHISTWETGRVTDMNNLFLAKASFNDDIGAWDTSGVTRMDGMFEDAEAFNQDISGWQVGNVKTTAFMFYGASAFNKPIDGWSIEAMTSMTSMFEDASTFDQDIGWCVDNGVNLDEAFLGTSCESTSCGVAQKDVIGICEPWARPCLLATGGQSQCIINSPTLIIAIVLIFLAAFGTCVCCRKKKDETYAAAVRRVLCGCLCCCFFCCRKKTEPSSVDSRPDSPAKSPSGEPNEEATALESLETRVAAAAAKAKAVETAERPGFARKLSSFLFGEQEEEPAVAEAEEVPPAEQPPLPPRRTEPEPAAKAEEMYNQIAAWYNGPENAALRARWGAYPDPDEFQTWPGFVAVTNAFLDREAG